MPGQHVSPAAFRRAWERTQERHGALRTSFHWQDLPKPLQVVEKPAGARIIARTALVVR